MHPRRLSGSCSRASTSLFSSRWSASRSPSSTVQGRGLRMAYDKALVDRVRAALLRRKGVTEKKMFGGVCFMVNGHMCCGVASKDLVLRLGEEGTAAALE